MRDFGEILYIALTVYVYYNVEASLNLIRFKTHIA